MQMFEYIYIIDIEVIGILTFSKCTYRYTTDVRDESSFHTQQITLSYELLVTDIKGAVF